MSYLVKSLSSILLSNSSDTRTALSSFSYAAYRMFQLFGDTSDNASYGGVPFEAQKSRITAAEEKTAMQDEFIDNGELR